MATTLKSQITPAGGGVPDPGYDYRYQYLNDWKTDVEGRGKDLVSRDVVELAEVFSGGNAATGGLAFDTFSGWNADSTRYLKIIAAAGHEHEGLWDTNKAYMSVSGARAIFLESTESAKGLYLHLVGMQIETTTSSTISATIYLYAGTNINNSATVTADKCIVRYTNTVSSRSSSLTVQAIQLYGSGDAGVTSYATIKNSVIIASFPNTISITGASTTVTIKTIEGTNINAGSILFYNSDLIVRTNGKTGTRPLVARVVNGGNKITTENCYLAFAGTADTQTCYNGAINKGANDATVNTEATNVALQNVAFSVVNFTNVGAGTEDLHITTGSVLKDAGADLSGSGVTYDYVGVSRPQGPAYDIGANEFENGPPICWNYTAKFKGSKKLFKTSGGGAFPRNLRVPGNVDKSTGKMIDDGVEIDPDHYEVF